jgi:hypothetical protein
VLRAFNVTPQNANDYEDLQMTVKNGVLELGTRCARFTATNSVRPSRTRRSTPRSIGGRSRAGPIATSRS